MPKISTYGASASTRESLKCKHSGVTQARLTWQETFSEESAMSKKETGANDVARWLKPSARERPLARSLTDLRFAPRDDVSILWRKA